VVIRGKKESVKLCVEIIESTIAKVNVSCKAKSDASMEESINHDVVVLYEGRDDLDSRGTLLIMYRHDTE